MHRKNYWITKTALTKGIFSIESDAQTVEAHYKGHYFGDMNSALENAKRLKAEKILKLERQLEGLKQLSFENDSTN